MGFLDKAKGAFKDLETQLDKVQQTIKETTLGSEDVKPAENKPAETQAGESSTAASTAASTTPGTATPASSFVRKKSSIKLPLAIRKEGMVHPLPLLQSIISDLQLVRDDWENKIDELEASLSKLLDTPWNIDIDAGEMYQLALETDSMGRHAKESPGAVLTE